MTPTTDIDLWNDETLLDPYPAHAALRELGPVVWMERYDAYVVCGYEEARTALRAWATYISGRGVFMNEPSNERLGGQILLCTDGDNHTRLRRVMAAPLTPKALEEVRDHIDSEAEQVVTRLVAAGTFDAAVDLAQYLPVTIVSSLVGVPEEGRERMVDWASAVFDTTGPLTSGRSAACRR